MILGENDKNAFFTHEIIIEIENKIEVLVTGKIKFINL